MSETGQKPLLERLQEAARGFDRPIGNVRGDILVVSAGPPATVLLLHEAAAELTRLQQANVALVEREKKLTAAIGKAQSRLYTMRQDFDNVTSYQIDLLRDQLQSALTQQ